MLGSGTVDNPIVVRSFGDEQYAGCTGVPADSHVVKWLVVRRTEITDRKVNGLIYCQMSRDRPLERCPECGNCLKMEYVGPTDDGHHHDHHRTHP